MPTARQLILSFLLCLALAACGRSPMSAPGVDPLRARMPAEINSGGTTPRFGHTLGSGHREETGSTTAVVSAEATAGDSVSVTEGRGGHTLGSGH